MDEFELLTRVQARVDRAAEGLVAAQREYVDAMLALDRLRHRGDDSSIYVRLNRIGNQRHRTTSHDLGPQT